MFARVARAKDIIAGDYDPVVVSPKNIFYGNPKLPSDRYVIVDGEHPGGGRPSRVT